MHSIDPATERVIAEYPEHGAEAVEERVAQAAAAQRSWARRSFEDRVPCLRAAAEVLRTEKTVHAERITAEMGKPLGQALGEIEKCAWVLDYYADTATEGLRAMVGPTDFESQIRFEPLGVVLAIMPWNFPYWQVFRCAAPILAAGNGVLLKHAENTTGCALAIEDVFRRSGVPAGLFSAVVVPVSTVPGLIADPRVAAVTLTGSTRAGASVASEAGKHLKKSVLELGGSDPYVVLEDADIDHAVAACAASRLLNGGQSCISAKRFLVVNAVREAFESQLAARFEAVRIGSPQEADVELGPLARADLRDTLADQVRRSVAAGARLIVGGRIPERPGWFYPATLLTEVRPGMPAHEEELFGPVGAVVPVRDEEEALAVANRSAYGLGAAVFTRNRARAERFAAGLQTGAVAVNDFVRSDPRLPFGGVKQSGFGRELSVFGLREFVNIKTLTFAKG